MWISKPWIREVQGSFRRSPRLWRIFTNAESCTETSKQATFSCASVEGRSKFQSFNCFCSTVLYKPQCVGIRWISNLSICFLWSRECPCALGANPATRHGVDRVGTISPSVGAPRSRSIPAVSLSGRFGAHWSGRKVGRLRCGQGRTHSWTLHGTPRQPPQVCSRAQTPAADPEWWSLKHNSSVMNAQSWHNKNRSWFPQNKVQTPHFMAPEVAKQSLGHREGTFCELQNDESIVQSHYDTILARWMDMLQTRHVMGTAQSRYEISTESGCP